MKRRVTVEIDLKALVRNYRKIAAHVKPAKVLCVLKANAYGLGVGAYAQALAKAGCTMFGVAELQRLERLGDAKPVGVRLQDAQHLRRPDMRRDLAVVPDQRLQVDFNRNSSFHFFNSLFEFKHRDTEAQRRGCQMLLRCPNSSNVFLSARSTGMIVASVKTA